MKFENEKYYLYRYNDTDVLTKVSQTDDGFIANDILKVSGSEEILEEWDIEDMYDGGNGPFEILGKYNSVEEFNKENQIDNIDNLTHDGKKEKLYRKISDTLNGFDTSKSLEDEGTKEWHTRSIKELAEAFTQLGNLYDKETNNK